MAIPSTGAVTFAMVQSEFGGANPIQLTEYYGIAAGVPTSGTISLSNFRGKSKAAAGSVTLTNSQDFTCRDGYKELTVCIIGGGGGGAGGNSGYHGGERGYTSSGIISVHAGQVINFQSGNGGAGGNVGGNGNNGGTSTFSSFSAGGGAGGQYHGTGGSGSTCYGSANDGWDDGNQNGGQAGFSNGGDGRQDGDGGMGSRGSGGGGGGGSNGYGGYGGDGCVKLSWG